MNRRSILTKTGKGLMEATGKTSNLSRDLRNILKEIDGKVSVSELLDKFDRMTEPKLIEVLTGMEREGYVREFVGKQDEGARRPAGSSPGSQSFGDASDLDFTSFTPSRPSAKASEEARLHAQAQEIARQAQATRAREEAAAKVKAELAARAKAEAELKAKQVPPAKPATAAPAPYAGILGAGPDAQARAQVDALDRARREADERQRKEAEEKARQEAEARAKAEIEEAIKRDAEERLRKEIQERTRREDEERARREAAARAKLEAEQRVKREAEERTRRELEERARKEIEERLRREEEERRRREEEERVRREAERKLRVEAEARARVEAELRARREAEERVRRAEEEQRQQELRKRTEAEERKRHEAEAAEALERALQEEQEKAQREAEERAQREEQEHAEREERERLEAEEEEQRREEEERRAKEEDRRARQEEKEAAKAAKLRKAERARERAGEEAWRGDEDALRDSGAGSLSAAEVWEKRKPRSFLKTLAVMLFVVLVVGIAVLPFVPLETAPYEKAAQAWLDQPVKIGSVNLSLVPLPQLKFEKVVIGREPQMRIAVIKANPDVTTLLQDRVSLRSLALDNVTLPREFLAALLRDRGGRRPLGIERIAAKGLKLEGQGLGLPPLDLEASLTPDGGLRSAEFSSSENQLSVKLEPKGGRAAVEISASALPLPIGLDFGLSDFQAKGTASASELVLSSVEGRAFGGRLAGSARLRWTSGWSLDGELSARLMDAAKLAAPLIGSGGLQGRAAFSMRGLLPERMVLNSQIEGSFTVQKGTISNVDMTRLLQGSGSGGGTTPFTEISGSFSADPNRLAVRQIRLAAGLLSGVGQLDMDSQKNLSGRMQIELRAQSVQARTTLGVGGTLTNPQFRRTN
jgi:hypothetical protein